MAYASYILIGWMASSADAMAAATVPAAGGVLPPPPLPSAAESFADLYDEDRMSFCKQSLFRDWFPGHAGDTCMAMMFYGYGEPKTLDCI